jgi:hypothetical protein
MESGASMRNLLVPMTFRSSWKVGAAGDTNFEKWAPVTPWGYALFQGVGYPPCVGASRLPLC